MKKGKVLKKVISVFIVVVIFFNFTVNSYAAVNEVYLENISDNQNTAGNTENKVISSGLLNAIGKMIYAVASMTEDLVGRVFFSLTGDNIFPWSDRIIFNTIPFLDVNFLNPSPGSLVSEENNSMAILPEILRNIYFTLLALSISFLSIVVGVYAIKLVLSTIPSEKGKIKSSLFNVIFAIIMLFCAHFLLAGIFFINEKLVEVASQILSKQLESTNIFISLETIDDATLVKNFVRKQEEMLRCGNIDEIGIEEDYVDMEPYEILKNDSKAQKYAAYYLRNKEFKRKYLYYASGSGEKTSSSNIFFKFFDWIAHNINKTGDAVNAINTVYYGYTKPTMELTQENYEKYIKSGEESKIIIATAWKEINDPNYKKLTDYTQLISGMGEYFREKAFSVEVDDEGNVTGWTISKITLEGAILYTMFIVQSIAYFFAYLKRFFYIIILAIMAPLVVIYDFLTKVT